MDWAAQVGFLSSPPKGGEQPRMAALQRAELPIPLPDLETEVEHSVVIVLQDSGMARSGGMGPQPLTATDLKDWVWGTGTDLSQWEFALTLSASRAFVRGCGADSPPYAPLLTKMALVSATAAEAEG